MTPEQLRDLTIASAAILALLGLLRLFTQRTLRIGAAVDEDAKRVREDCAKRETEWAAREHRAITERDAWMARYFEIEDRLEKQTDAFAAISDYALTKRP